MLKVLALAAAFALAACGTEPQAGNVTEARLLAAGDDPDNWLSHGRTYAEQRFSPLTDINEANVGELSLAWAVELDTNRGQEATPVVVDGTMYISTAWSKVMAVDAATGEVLWRYDPEPKGAQGAYACCDVVNRGVAVWQGKVFAGTIDGRLVALDAATGKELWDVLTVDQARPYTITGAPRVVRGKVIIGNSGAELGVRGYVSAYDAESGDLAWRFYTVPGNPADGPDGAASDEAFARFAGKTWNGTWWEMGGGGTVWDAIVYDPEFDQLLIGVGNGSPWNHRARSAGKGDNLFLSSILALNPDTGAYKWHYQVNPGETWDFTATQQITLADLTIEGEVRKVAMQAPKNGFFYVLDRATGELISAETIAPINWATGVDPATGRPIENPAARYGTTPVMVSPGAGGAHNWNPMAFSPLTGLVYVPVTETYMAYGAAETYDPARGGLGTSFTGFDAERKAIAEYADAHSKGWLSAWNPATQREAWRGPIEQKGSGGVLVTAGNLVFQGTIGQTFAAYRADTGARVWEMPVQQVPIAAPIAYEVDGEQYIAVNAGWGGGLAHVERAQYTQLFLSKPRLLVFKLGGTAQLPPLPPESMQVPELSPPPPLTGSPEQVALGERLYGETCGLCHGTAARGGVKDLRHMSPQTHAAFLAIVLEGTRAANGMASFADVLSRDQAEAIHHYLIARARDDWEE